MKTGHISSIPFRWVFAFLVAGLFSIPANAGDITVFGGIHTGGHLTYESAQSGTSNLVQNLDLKTFGVFGARFSHGKVIGGEHTIAYAPNFVDSNNHAFIYHSNLRVQIPIWGIKPYGTAGIGLINSSGSSNAFGTEFAYNYGGGVKLTAGPVGVNLDVRGYTVPNVSVSGFSVQNHLNFLQTSAGIVFTF